jgi:hypothetical protein
LCCGTFNGEVFELVVFLQHLGLLLLGLLWELGFLGGV